MRPAPLPPEYRTCAIQVRPLAAEPDHDGGEDGREQDGEGGKDGPTLAQDVVEGLVGGANAAAEDDQEQKVPGALVVGEAAVGDEEEEAEGEDEVGPAVAGVLEGDR